MSDFKRSPEFRPVFRKTRSPQAAARMRVIYMIGTVSVLLWLSAVGWLDDVFNWISGLLTGAAQ